MIQIWTTEKIKKYLKNPSILFYILETKLVRLFYKLLNLHLISDPFISGDTIKNI